jgi:hypothetical protein
MLFSLTAAARPCSSPPKTDAARYPHPDAHVLLIIGVRFGTISAGRQEGDIRDSGCPAAVRTANSEPKAARKTTGGALAITNLRR